MDAAGISAIVDLMLTMDPDTPEAEKIMVIFYGLSAKERALVLAELLNRLEA